MAREHKSTRIEKDLIDKVQTLADKQRRSYSNMLEVVLQDYFDSRQAQKEKAV